ncbi:hypothetical protein [Nonomuraea basaltis]|uniref:hypothetical protein n=1 Tax=Nonomuraea basaltis TaxID=2495887 RepID=UPI00110C5CB8|nr:hypothetical protein [Nonomuraea basaltis]TMR94016.1 hypothetical protein EJK15_36160 [Nonomuraea basaltis]
MAGYAGLAAHTLDLSRLLEQRRRWPTHHENVHFYGIQSVDIDGELAQLDADGYRPLRLPEASAAGGLTGRSLWRSGGDVEQHLGMARLIIQRAPAGQSRTIRMHYSELGLTP